jgi:hypothetical protein
MSTAALAKAITGIAVLATTATLITSAASATGRSGPEPAWVTAESDYGHGRVSGPTRPARFGYQVRLPGGSWVDCRGDCAEELRIQTVDFWESKGAGNNSLDGHRLLRRFRWSF